MSPTATFLWNLYHNFYNSLDQPAPGNSDVSQGVEPSRPLEEETGNQPVESNVHVEGAVELYRPESRVSRTASDTLHQSLHLKQPGTYIQ
jgi:hypothetical protein